MANESKEIHGTLFDLYPERDRMILWVITDEGERLRLREPFSPSFFVRGEKEQLRRFLERVRHSSVAEVRGPAERLDFWTGKPIPVIECAILDLTDFPSALSRFGKDFPDLDFYNCDLLSTQHYTYATDLFPLCRGRFRYREDGILESFTSEDSSWSNDYELPPLRMMRLEGEGTLYAKGPRLHSLTIEMDGEEYEFTHEPMEIVLTELNHLLDRYDPDVILSKGGDSFLFPFLLTAAHRLKIPLRLDRDPVERKVVTQGRSFFSYGQVLYQAPDYPLFGRWHLDRENSFLLDNTSLEGLVEVARVSRMPIQRIARRSIGTAITSIQLALAYREGFLIPWKKTHPEAWKTAWTLLHTDRGGLVYQPILGFHENVYELDFASMYPSIMAEFNVSPETVNCPCCKNEKVPEIHYTICERRHGLVSRALRPILEKRKFYKRERGRSEGAEYRKFDSRQSALKWLLVCCFGYLGYRNARFGRIEAHEKGRQLS
jgi:DNA polymerase-2